MLNRSALWILIILGILVVITSWYSVQMSIIVPVISANIAQTGKLYHGSVVQTNAQGLISYRGSVTDATQTGAGVIYFNHLVGTIYDAERIPWFLNSDQGVVLSGGQEVTLTGHVTLVKSAVPNNPSLTFATTSATIFPQTQVVTGTDWLTITQAGTHNMLMGKGFRGDFLNKTYELQSQVKGIYYAKP